MNTVTSVSSMVAVHPHLPTELELCARIIIAALLGGLIGLEREVSDHPSGLRTHIAVAIGAATFGVTSAYAFGEFVALRNDNNYQIDVTRIASQVVVGIGFLGGGAIIKQGNSVRGLTSAAGLWVSAAIGLAVSLGLYLQAVTATVGLLATMIFLRLPRRWLRGRIGMQRSNVVITIPINADPTHIVAILNSLADTSIKSIEVRDRPSHDVKVIEADLQVRGGMLQQHLDVVENHPDVLSIEVS